MKKIMAGLLCVMLIMTGCLAAQGISEQTKQPIAPEASNHVEWSSLSENSESIQLLDDPRKEAGENTVDNFYSDTILYHINYPFFDRKSLDEPIKAFLEKTIKQFMDDANIPYLLDPEWKSEMHIDYEVWKIDNYYSIRFVILQNLHGNVHPHYTMRTFLVDAEQMKPVALDELLKEGYKKQFRDLIAKRQAAQEAPYMTKQELDTLEFDNYVLEEGALVLVFDPYIIQPGSEGFQEVTISLNRLKPLLKKEISGVSAPVEEPVVEKPVVKPQETPKYDASKKTLAITFDDGPSAHTPKLLDGMKKHGARGTFFVLGVQIKGREKTLQRMISEGHTIGNHSYNYK